MRYINVPNCQISNLVDIYLSHFGYITNGRVVEIGAFNCYNWSNSHCLITAGWQGLLVEPQPDMIAECQELYRSNDNVILERCCIGSKNDTVKLYLGGSNSTIKPEMVDIYNGIEWSKFSGLDADKFIECEMVTLDFLLEKYEWQPGFEVLIIDVEGAELDVLDGFSIDRYRPKLVIVETHELEPHKELSEKAGGINRYFDNHSYSKIYTDHINSIYELWT